jgi:UDP-N-acetylmuramate--alanine ligase
MIAGVPERVHIIGIGGGAMSGIARILHAEGHQLTGSDERSTEVTQSLERLGIPIALGQSAENVGAAQLVVTTSAASADNVELVEAHRRTVPVMKRDAMLARLMENKVSVAIAGTHGKTTTSSLMAHILADAGRDPSFLVGGDVLTLGTNARPGAGPHIVVEADEFDRAFLAYHPDIAIVTNVEADHLDVYGTLDEVARAFAQFMSQAKSSGVVITCADDAVLARTAASASIAATHETYGIDNEAIWRASNIRRCERGQSFDVTRAGQQYGTFSTSLVGAHNVLNATACIAASAALGLTEGETHDALVAFRGAHRRFELLGEVNGITLMDDYAHHPTEVLATMRAAKDHFAGRRLVAIFQPHTFYRNEYLLDQWTACFTPIDVLYLLETVGGRYEPSAGMTSAELARHITEPPATYVATVEDAVATIAPALRPGDVFFTIGSYNDEVGPALLRKLRGGT